jgi:hypothetical protein
LNAGDNPHKAIGKVVSTDARATLAGKPFVVVLVNDEEVGQLTPGEAIAMGTRFIQSGIEAERDAGTVAFLTSFEGGMDEQAIAAFIVAMREHRQQAEPREGMGN